MAEIALAVAPAVIGGIAALVPQLIDMFTPEKKPVNLSSMTDFDKQPHTIPILHGGVTNLAGGPKSMQLTEAGKQALTRTMPGAPLLHKTSVGVDPLVLPTPKVLGGTKTKAPRTRKPREAKESLKDKAAAEMKEMLSEIESVMLTEKQEQKVMNLIQSLKDGEPLNETDRKMFKKIIGIAKRQSAL